MSNRNTIKVGYTLPVDVIRLIDRNYRSTREPRSKYIARLVRQDAVENNLACWTTCEWCGNVVFRMVDEPLTCNKCGYRE